MKTLVSVWVTIDGQDKNRSDVNETNNFPNHPHQRTALARLRTAHLQDPESWSRVQFVQLQTSASLIPWLQALRTLIPLTREANLVSQSRGT